MASKVDSQDLIKNAALAVRKSNHVPSQGEWTYYQNFPSFVEQTQHLDRKILQIIQKVLIQTSTDDYELDTQDVHSQFEKISDVVEKLLETADVSIDEHFGREQTKSVVQSGFSDTKKKQNRPQDYFQDTIDNRRDTPHIPKLSGKEEPNLLINGNNRRLSVGSDLKNHLEDLGFDTDSSVPFQIHPFESEIRNLEYTQEQMDRIPEKPYKSLEETSCVWIETVDNLEQLNEDLKLVNEFAVDLEHHNFRSFQGFTCLMQISTRTNDYLIDTIALRSHIHILANHFHNPTVVKVFHGSDNDVLWLQRDFGIYVVNMFDTGQAARVLEYPGFSLSDLLKYHCGDETNKKYQLYDWRVRPLPSDVLKYAREDTHYLLYIYDCMRNELISRSDESGMNLLLTTLNRSNELCLHLYVKTQFDPMGFLDLIQRLNIELNTEQTQVLSAVWDWRDRIARESDESVAYVMPKHVMIKLAEVAPTTTEQLFSCCRPTTPLIREFAIDLINTIASAKEFSSIQTLKPVEKMPIETNISTQRRGKGFTPISPQDYKVEATSPTLSTEQLFQSASWKQSPKNVSISDLNKLGASTPQQHSLLFDSTQEKKTYEELAALEKAEGLLLVLRYINDFNDEVVEKEEEAINSVQESRVPSSLREIYGISNKNRRKIKEKKKIRDPGDQEEFVLEEMDRVVGTTHRDAMQSFQKDTEKDNCDVAEFVQSIGWINESVKKSLAKSENSTKTSERQVHSFDYSQRPSFMTEKKRHIDTDQTQFNPFLRERGRGKKTQKNRK